MGDSGGGGDFAYEDPKLDEKLDHDDDKEKKVAETGLFNLFRLLPPTMAVRQ